MFGDTSLIKKPKQQSDNKNKKGWNPAAKKFKATSWEVQDPQHFGTEQVRLYGPHTLAYTHNTLV